MIGRLSCQRLIRDTGLVLLEIVRAQALTSPMDE